MSAGKAYRLGVLHGDGIGPEIVTAAVAVLEEAASSGGAEFECSELPLGRAAIDTHGSALPEETPAALAGVDGWLLGPHDSVSYPEPHRSRLNPSGAIRKHFDLFANIRPARAFPGGHALVGNTDLVMVRENTEGFYADRNTFAGSGEMMPTPDIAIAHGIITRAGTTRIAHEAFRLAATRRKHVTIVHKANVLRLTSGLFRDVCREVAAEYPDIEVDELHVDAATVHLVRRGDQFDVLVAENLFGDILSDLAGEVAGSLGIAPSLNAGESHAMAQAAHGSAPDIAGRDLANPVAMILSTAMLLRWLCGRHDDTRLLDVADRIERAVEATAARGVVTPDLGGTASTSGFTTSVLEAIRAGA
ncbi:isocitrate/isopropylmalate dehydrogenase family protein [Myceligenerans pegani]|uniref:Isocitrate/isopropylmalate dehydrogenase family protein n=1 Tax=Myceligenerans pegani TaxID=2776917 RepID=A0ABR9N5B9_9MICO|nr:isocitrate/isopropylmalate dehydrogenase family protein [Myceligenerans sp. TRM 65318]MBE1878545.1 isocitrate/isopropylmalate dehydrogenase family protein [Myceligenerans sp. TRM 65318]MBE3020816.1 isocitrate/isopropylmalate dehydrogenase family protein [Myceligenerans sp. TRM 65318]